jgi:hypothetical protein
MLLAAALACLASGTSARASDFSSRGATEERVPRHAAIRDWLAVAVAMGTIAGIAEGQCEDKAMEFGPVAGHSAIVLLFGAFYGASWGGEQSQPNPYQQVHSRDWKTRPSASLDALQSESRKVRVRLTDGASLTGSLSEVSAQSVSVQSGREQRTVEGVMIRTIERPRDSLLDGTLLSAGVGAAYGYFAANACDGDRPKSERRPEMMAIGAAVMGVTGFAIDLVHGGTSVLYRAEGTAVAPTFEFQPVLMVAGAGVPMSLRF